MTFDFDKHTFLKEINSFPAWIKDADELMLYCRYLMYKILQTKNMYQWQKDQCVLSEEDQWPEREIECFYQMCYAEKSPALIPFEEFLIKRSRAYLDCTPVPAHSLEQDNATKGL